MKKNSLLKMLMPVFLVLSLVFFLSLGEGEKQQNKTVSWTMALQNIKSKDMLNFSSPVPAETGEIYRLIINPGTDCFCYVIAESTNNDEVAVLQAGKLEGGKAWFSQDMEVTPPSGSESIFVIVSLGEQSSLNQAINAFNSNNGTTQRRALMNEVFSIRSEVSLLKETPEKPVLMGGSARGNPGQNEGVEYSGLETYVKTISLEH